MLLLDIPSKTGMVGKYEEQHSKKGGSLLMHDYSTCTDKVPLGLISINNDNNTT